MLKGILPTALLMIFSVVLVPGAHAQYFKFDNLQEEPDPAATAELEVEAIVKMFGSLVGSGLYQSADLHSVGGFDVGLRGVLTNVPDKFDNLPVFADEDRIGLAFLHGSLGLPGNFELFGRFFYFPLGSDPDLTLDPPRAADSRGGVTLIGGGLKYGLLQQLGLPKVMLMGTYHALFVPDEFDFGNVGTLSVNAVASHSLAIATVYVGAGFDLTSLKVDENIPLPIAAERFTETVFRYEVGASVTPFPFVRANASLNFGEFNSFDLGLGLSVR